MFRIFTIIATLSLFVTQAFAIDAPTEIQVVSVSDTSASLEWTENPDAVGYYFYYGTQPAVGDNYEYEGVELITNNEYVLENLRENTEYFFAISALTDDNQESDYSSELSFTTLGAGDASESGMLTLDEVEIIDASTITLSFSKLLNTSPEGTRDFIVADTLSNSEIRVERSEFSQENEKEITLFLESDLTQGVEYRVTVLEIYGKNGENIEFGIDGFKEFLVPMQDSLEGEADLSDPAMDSGYEDPNSQYPQHNNENISDLDTGSQDPMSQSSMGGAGETQTSIDLDLENSQGADALAGESISDEEMQAGVVLAAANSDALPETGPEHILLVFIAMTLGLVWMRRKK